MLNLRLKIINNRLIQFLILVWALYSWCHSLWLDTHNTKNEMNFFLSNICDMKSASVLENPYNLRKLKFHDCLCNKCSHHLSQFVYSSFCAYVFLVFFVFTSFWYGIRKGHRKERRIIDHRSTDSGCHFRGTCCWTSTNHHLWGHDQGSGVGWDPKN